MIDAARLREVLHYNPESGIFRWRHKLTKAGKGKPAGGLNHRRYRQIMIDGRRYSAHRLVWLYMTGEWPPHQIDHIDRDGFNNSWANLRLATGSQNCANSRRPKHNTSGFKGVYRMRDREGWRAAIRHGGTRRYLGTFDTAEAAYEAYRRAATELFGEFARNR